MAEPGDAKGGRHWLVWAGGAALALLLILVVAFLIASRPPVSNSIVAWLLDMRGGGPAKVTGAYIGLGRTRIAEANVGADLAIKELDARYGFPGILAARVNSVRVRSIKIVAAYKEGAIELPVVGKLGGGKATPNAQMNLPSVAVDEFDGSILGFPIPVALNGKLGLVPQPNAAGTYRFEFSGNSDFGAELPTEIVLSFDGAGNASLDINAGESGPGIPGRDSLPSDKPGLLIDSLIAKLGIAAGKLQSADAKLLIRAGNLPGLGFGASQLQLQMDDATSGTLDASVGDIRLSPERSDAVAKSLSATLVPWKARAPFGAFASDIDALVALPRGQGRISGHFEISQTATAANATWHAEIESLDATLSPAEGEPLDLHIGAAFDGPAHVDMRLGDTPGLGAHFGLSLTGPGPDISAGAVDISSVSGGSGSLIDKVSALDLSDLKVDWRGKGVTLGLAAQKIHAMPAGRDVLALTGTILSVDGALMDGISAKALRADLSGMVTKDQTVWIIRPNDGCFDLDFAALAISTLHLSNGDLRACAQPSVPIVAFDSGSATTRINAAIVGGPILADGGSKESRVRIASLAAMASGEMTSAATGFQLTAIRSRIVDAQSSPRFAPLDVTSELQLADNRVTGSFDTHALGKSILTAKLDHDLADGRGSLGFTTSDLLFQRGGVDLPKLLPVLRGMVTSAAGKIRLQGRVAWSSGRALTSNGTLALGGFGVTTKLGRIEGIDGTIALNRLWPARSPAPQVLKVKTMDVGLPLADGVVTFNLPERLSLEIVKAVWPWAGGQLAVVDGAFVPGEKVQHVAMTADAVDLTEVFKLLSIDGLSGSGIVDGRLPIEVREGDAFIVGGLLKAREGGVLKYNGEAAAVAATKGQGANLLFTALKNFNYQSLEIGVEGRVTGTIIVSLKLRGYNPDLYDGYPFELNIKIDSELANLISQTTQGLRIPEQIEKALPGAQ